MKMATTANGTNLGVSSEQVNNAYMFPFFKTFQAGTIDSGQVLPAAGTGLTVLLPFPNAFKGGYTPFVILTNVTAGTSVNNQCMYTLLSVSNTQMRVRLFPATPTGGTQNVTFSYMAW